MALWRYEGCPEDFQLVYRNILGCSALAPVLLSLAIPTQERHSLSMGSLDFLWNHVLRVDGLRTPAGQIRDQDLADSVAAGKQPTAA